MNLDQYKEKWNKEFNENNPINLNQLTQDVSKKFNSNILKLAFPEILIAGLSVFCALFLVAFFYHFNSVTHKLFAILAIILLTLIPAFNLRNIYKFYKIGQLSLPIDDTINSFSEQSTLFIKSQTYVQTLQIFSMALLIVLIPLVYSEELSNSQLAIAFIVGFILLLILSHFIKRIHKRHLLKNKMLLEFINSKED